VILSVTVQIALTIGFVVLAGNVAAQDARNSAAQAAVSAAEHASQVASCVAGNKTRARTGRIIAEIIALLPPGNTAKVTDLKRDVAKNYKLNNCAAMYSVKS